MRKIKLIVLAVVIASSVLPAVPASAVCDESEGCTPCGGPTVVVDGKNTRIDWVVC